MQRIILIFFLSRRLRCTTDAKRLNILANYYQWVFIYDDYLIMTCFNIEQAWGETHNLLIVSIREGRSVQGSIDYVGDRVKERFNAYVSDKEKIPSWGSKIDQDVATYLAAVEQWAIGFIHWSFATERYFGKSHEEVKKTRVVTLLPRRKA